MISCMADPEHILIIKTSAAGDVVRTTCLLQLFKNAKITWLTDEACLPLFADHPAGKLELISIRQIPPVKLQQQYDLVISLEEEESCARLASAAHKDKLCGIYWDNGLEYTPDAATWYDMSLVSKKGKEAANALKKANKKSYQEILFGMLQRSFHAEPYTIFQPDAKRQPLLIGLEKTAGQRWPNKAWFGFDELAEVLQLLGFQVVYFERQKYLRDYMQAISTCSLLVSGDTLGMHLALAYQVPVVGLFTCTSPAEIHDYGLLQKIISARLDEFYYDTAYDPAATRAIPVATVLETVMVHWARFYPAPGQTKVHDAFSGFQR